MRVQGKSAVVGVHTLPGDDALARPKSTCTKEKPPSHYWEGGFSLISFFVLVAFGLVSCRLRGAPPAAAGGAHR